MNEEAKSRNLGKFAPSPSWLRPLSSEIVHRSRIKRSPVEREGERREHEGNYARPDPAEIGYEEKRRLEVFDSLDDTEL